ncbi:GNAT family N-acetyltransferase [Pseudomonas weihenstephanensis]|uniref:GNAT family N-acetyltransferase n=1 Tax=Pseudomonas weihenstephanensis TaxID=1608994 RepID=UPI00193C541F|nr:GNAT family protein [Pseudomonas weihenstephanensis]MBM1191328.1 GNAT family N-acetyltransferase [Pseudomonas weihenstephanensis]
MSESLQHWQPATTPDNRTLEGLYIRLEKLDPARHGDDLWLALQGPDSDPKLWDYLPYGPFPERSAFDALLEKNAASADPHFYAVIDSANDQAQGMLSLMCIVPEHGRIEIGHVAFGAPMQRSPKSTEAVYLLAKEAFALGNRRLEWKCNNDNTRSKRTAVRLGYTFEGVFRQHMVVKGKNRDTTWYSIISTQWSSVAAGFEKWLALDNQPKSGQIKSLEECRASTV